MYTMFGLYRHNIVPILLNSVLFAYILLAYAFYIGMIKFYLHIKM